MFMCPRAFRMIDAHAQENQDPNNTFVSSPVDLKEDNSARIKYLHNNSGVSVPVRLLAIKESIECHVKECEFNAPNYNGAVCQITHNKWAHLYVYTQTGSKYIEHCIVAFVEGTRIKEHDELFDILCQTVKWLKIENNKPHFFIYYLPPPAIQLNLDRARLKITGLMREHLNNYEEGEAFCETSGVLTYAANCTINKSNPYRFKVS